MYIFPYIIIIYHNLYMDKGKIFSVSAILTPKKGFTPNTMELKHSHSNPKG